MSAVHTPVRSQTGSSSIPPSRPTSPPSTVRPNNATPSTIGKNDDRRRARREQLRKFYGINETLESGSEAKGAPGTKPGRKGGNVLDIDSVDFDAMAYYEDLIKKSSLAELMQKAVTLNAEIGDLQSSRHSLVYNHHHKLFSAGDAIQVLNTRTPQLISIVTSLQDSFSSISQLADSVALPDLPLPNGDSSADQQGLDLLDRAERALRRMRLMRTAELPPESIRAVFGKIEAELVDEAASGNQEAARLLKEGRDLVPRIETDTA